jgi:hypothetical protein
MPRVARSIITMRVRRARFLVVPSPSVEEIGRMQRWADETEGEHVSYLVDRDPATN